jgi:hypothetical protein
MPAAPQKKLRLESAKEYSLQKWYEQRPHCTTITYPTVESTRIEVGTVLPSPEAKSLSNRIRSKSMKLFRYSKPGHLHSGPGLCLGGGRACNLCLDDGDDGEGPRCMGWSSELPREPRREPG